MTGENRQCNGFCGNSHIQRTDDSARNAAPTEDSFETSSLYSQSKSNFPVRSGVLRVTWLFKTV